MNPQTPTANFIAIQDDVVGMAAELVWLLSIFKNPLCERMVHGLIAILVFIPLQQRPIHNPEEMKQTRVNQI